MIMRSTLALVAASAVVLGGCLATTYKIPRGELARLAATPPEARGAEVRVVQELEGETPPPTQPVSAETQVVFVPRTVIVVDAGGGRRHGNGGTRIPGVRGGGGGGGKGSDKGAVIALVAMAAAAGVVLAATEGQRYDGWVRLHPMHPVHLWGPWGYGVLPLAQIDPATAAQSYKAVVRESEGPWQRLARAPLDREGWTYSVLGGVGDIGGPDGNARGPAFHVQLGYFPSHQVGVQLEWMPSWRDDDLGETVLDMRWGLELDLLPLDAGPVHGGVFGTLATGFRDDREGTTSGVFTGGGALLQLELSTRLALTGRLGLTRAYRELESDVTVGLSIY